MEAADEARLCRSSRQEALLFGRRGRGGWVRAIFSRGTQCQGSARSRATRRSESPTIPTYLSKRRSPRSTTAIMRLALDYLQAARAKDPKNARVLNAFGVVYDKLGRFDLSARYYAQASAPDPNSPIVAKNMSYSRWLQGLFDPRPASSRIASAESQRIPLAKGKCDGVRAAPRDTKGRPGRTFCRLRRLNRLLELRSRCRHRARLAPGPREIISH